MDSRQKLKNQNNNNGYEYGPILSAADLQQNEEKWGEFRASIEALKAEFAEGEIIGISDYGKKKFSDLLDNLMTISSADATEPDQEKMYALKISDIILSLDELTTQIRAMKLSSTPGDEVNRLQVANRNKTAFNQQLNKLSESMRYCLKVEHKTKQKIKYSIIATVILAVVVSIPLILLLCGVLTTPIIIGFAFFLAAGVAIVSSSIVGLKYVNKMQKLTAPIYHPIKETLSGFINGITQGIENNKKRLPIARREQERQMLNQEVRASVKFRRDAFFGFDKTNQQESACYLDLSKKRDAKLQSLQADLVKAKKELEDVETALKLTLELIDDGNEAAVLNYEKRVLAKASTEEVKKDIVVLGDNRYQQTVDARICTKKIEALEAAIQKHQAAGYVDSKFHHYAETKYPESVIADVLAFNKPTTMYGREVFDYYSGPRFSHTPLQVKPHEQARPSILSFWRNENHGTIATVSSKKVNAALRVELEKVHAVAAEERKKRCIS